MSPNRKDNALSGDPDALLAELTVVHGPEVAAVAYRAITGEAPPRDRRSESRFSSARCAPVVGVRAKAHAAISEPSRKARAGGVYDITETGPAGEVKPKRRTRGYVRKP